MKSPLTFTKIVSTPTPSSWSQAYNAGNLAAVISLTYQQTEGTEDGYAADFSLPSLGKELLNTLEAEYFTLETKNLQTIKHALLTTCEKLTGPITLSLCLSVIIENILYVCIYGKGRVLMKREDKLGILLQQQEDAQLATGSGFIQNNDIIILETPQFAELIHDDTLLPALKHDALFDMAEALSPTIHQHQDGGAAALAFSYTEDAKTAPNPLQKATKLPLPEETITPDTLSADDFVLPDEKEILANKPVDAGDDHEESTEEETEEQERHQTFTSPRKKYGLPLSHNRRLVLTIAVVIALVLVASIYFAIQKQQNGARQALVNTTIVPAQRKYDEGQSLMDLNKSLARDDFNAAKQTLAPALSQLPAHSKELQQAQALDAKITDALNNTAQVTSVNATPVDNTNSQLLAAQAQINAPYVATDGTTVYAATNTTIETLKGTTTKSVISNAGDWTTIGGFGVYLGNFYVVDKKGAIIKYPGGKAPKANYLATGVAPDLSHAVDMAIDGSLWVLSSSGNIDKFTKGVEDQFTIKGLDKPLTNPTRIVTSTDDDNVYILDSDNKRIVVLDKTGNFTAQYAATILGTATNIDVHEKDKKVYVLSSGKVYEIDTK